MTSTATMPETPSSSTSRRASARRSGIVPVSGRAWETCDGAEAASFAAGLQDALASPHVYCGKTLVARSSISLGFYSAAFNAASEMFVATDKALMSHKHSDKIGIACAGADDRLSLAS